MTTTWFHVFHRRLHTRTAHLSNRLKEKLAIAVIASVGSLYFEKQSPINGSQLAAQLGIGAEACNKVVNALLDAKLLIRTSDDPPALIPGYALEVMQLTDVVNAVRTSGESDFLNPTVISSSTNVQLAFERLEDGLQTSLGNLTVKDLLHTGDSDQGGNVENVDENNVHKITHS